MFRSPVVDNQLPYYSPTDYRTYFTFWNLISNHLESNRRLVADCLAWRDLHNLLNHPAFKRNSYIFTTIRGQFHEYMLEFLLKWGWYNWLCKSAPTTSRRPVADQLRTTLPLFLHHLHFSGSNVYSFCMAALFGCRWLLMLHRKPLADQNCSAIINNHLPTIETTRKKGGCRRSARGCRCNSLTTSHRSSTNICRPPTTSGNHPKNSGC